MMTIDSKVRAESISVVPAFQVPKVFFLACLDRRDPAAVQHH
jgi:hypothetical protein